MKITLAPEIQENQKYFINTLPSYVKKQIEEIFGEQVTEEQLAKETLDENEDILEAFNDVLPKELVDKKLAECKTQQKNLLDSLKSLTQLLESRKNTWEVEGTEEQQQEALATIKILSSARFDQALFLGRGNAGHVFLAPGAEDYCIKYLYNPTKQFFSLDEEYTLLGQINRTSKEFEVLRIPQAHCMAKNTEGSKNFFTMQKVEGLTLAQLVDFPSKRFTEYPNLSTEKIIEILEDKNLLEKLLHDLSTLHNSGVIHRDIHPRNIMLDPRGNFFLIDFGNAIVPVNVSTKVTYENIENIKELDIRTFVNSIKKTADALKEQLTQ